MAEKGKDRSLTIRYRIEEAPRFSASNLKALQHVMTDWLPRAIYNELTDDTVRVDVIVCRDFTFNANRHKISFVNAEDIVLKSKEYVERDIVGQKCAYYDPETSRYRGNKDGFEHRLVHYKLP
jgi:hypothetical protein